jgi:hypothetical protein
MLDKAKRPPEAVAQLVIGGALREVCQVSALHFARAAAAMLAVSLVLQAMT